MNINFMDYMKKQVEERYSIGQNAVTNKAIYNLFCKTNYSFDYVISPNIAFMYHSLMYSSKIIVDFRHMIKICDINLREVQTNLIKIKKMGNIDLVSIGYGGLSINIIHFMYLLSLETKQLFWLNNLRIFENDKLSLSNSIRVYKDLSAFKGFNGVPINKTYILGDDRNIAKELMIKRRYFSKDDLDFKNEELDGFMTDKKTFIFGAPDFKTRKMLEDTNFIFTGHSGNDIEFYSSPKVDSDLTRETYGKIDLDYFFPNMLKGAEQLIHIMANYNPDDFKPDTKIWSFNSEKDRA